jgi:hypothetical protein
MGKEKIHISLVVIGHVDAGKLLSLLFCSGCVVSAGNDDLVSRVCVCFLRFVSDTSQQTMDCAQQYHVITSGI